MNEVDQVAKLRYQQQQKRLSFFLVFVDVSVCTTVCMSLMPCPLRAVAIKEWTQSVSLAGSHALS